MSEAKEAEKPNATFLHREDSPTAANAHNRLYPPSGSMAYAVTLAGGMGMMVQTFDAHTGDEAAEKALMAFPGAKVAKVEPAAQKAA